MNFPHRHLSIRVPWHDHAWIGTVCNKPTLNSACLCLKNIGEKKREADEETVRGQSVESLDEAQYPPCVMERATFMAPFAFTKHHSHPYTQSSPKTHSHFVPTPLRFPAYSAPGVPFRWMQREMVWGKKDEKWPIRGLKEDFPLEGVTESREPDLGFKTAWMQDAQNHTELLNCFWNHIREEESLVFFYAKQIPLTEEPARRVIVGVGRVQKIGPLTEYAYNDQRQPDSCRSLLWERMVTHTIRPGFKDGFLMPYHQALAKMEANPDFDPTPLIAFAPADRTAEFSFATEHVTPDGALSSLLVVADALRHAQTCLEGDFSKQIAWIDEQITRLWKQRGPCPGLGAVLGAMGIPLGSFVANEIVEQAGPEVDPWPLVEEMFEDPEAHLSPELASRVDPVVGKGWKRRSDTRKAFIQLLSRFDLTLDQARMLYSSENREAEGIDISDGDLVDNPYLIYESTRLLPKGLAIAVSVIDRGVFPEDSIRTQVPLPVPSALKSGIDIRRLRALTIERLEFHASQGHTLQPCKTLIAEIRELPLDPRCEVTSDTMEVAEDELFGGEINRIKLADKTDGYQLCRLADCGRLVRDLVQKRIKAAPHDLEADWARLLDDTLREGGATSDELAERDKLARQEKVAALEILATRRFSVLIGPAGTGKTTLLSALVRQEDIAAGGVLLLAPTGKARVRMEEKVGDKRFPAKTIAQFLNRTNRFDGAAQRYLLTGEPGDKEAETVIIDECSMMTEEMLAATFEALAGVKRLILVGDHRQLPPIGAGKPFVDIVRYLEPENFESPFPRLHAETGYTELTVSMRQSEVAGGRDDVRLAGWFTGAELAPGEDDVLGLLNGRRQSKHLEIREWNSPQELHDQLAAALHQELGMNGELTQERFDQLLGATLNNGYTYFNAGQAGRKAEAWQILTPVRQHPWGVSELNRNLHNEWRKGTLELARKKWGKICKPLGAEQIVYGDKVINNRNHGRWSWSPGARRSLANGEIGMVVTKWGSTNEVHVEFSTQPGFNFTYKPGEFSEDGSTDLELAYALTVHRAQGSEFGIVFLILPKNRRMLSREMLYTALTRQRDKVVILCEGPAMDLVSLASDRFSETKTRLTNLFRPPHPKLFEKSYLDANLIHQTERGELVRSKSEVIIADHLHRRRINYRYEEKLQLGEDVRIPDFTFDDDDAGITYFWEHCGMLFNADYAKRWEEKKALYREHGIEEGGGKKGTLIITHDDSVGGISSKAIGELIEKLL
ncbi:MAG: AAA family ATPase [Verrucomicrobiaceae bacterium]|nr:AAA family ATPase [Verrucomicrobiaceae bacterium]